MHSSSKEVEWRTGWEASSNSIFMSRDRIPISQHVLLKRQVLTRCWCHRINSQLHSTHYVRGEFEPNLDATGLNPTYSVRTIGEASFNSILISRDRTPLLPLHRTPAKTPKMLIFFFLWYCNYYHLFIKLLSYISLSWNWMGALNNCSKCAFLEECTFIAKASLW